MRRLLLALASGSFLALQTLAVTSPASPATGPRPSPPAATAGELTPQQHEWIARAHRLDREGWVYLRIDGPPRERGFQHGYLLAKEIDASLRAARRGWEYQSGMEWTWLVQKGERMFLPRIDPELLAELDGIVEGLAAAGVRTTRAEIITYNGSTELGGYWWPTAKKKIGARSPDRPQQSCSSFIATGGMTADGGIVLGHNTMTSYPSADCDIVFEIVPRTGHRILMQGVPGWIHSGTDFFVTEAGLVGSETTIGGFSGFEEKGVPEFVRMRRAAQDASTIDEWCTIMRRGNNGGYANAWLVGDVKTSEIARLELGLKHVGFERTKDGYFVGSNLAEDLKILRLETDEHETDIRVSGVARRVRWTQLMREHRGRITAELAKSFEGDHLDTYLGQERLGSRSLCAHWEDETTDPGEAPFDPSGTVDAKVVDSQMAKRMSFAARWGSGCGTPFDAAQFLEKHPQFGWMREILRSRPSHPWVEFRAGE
ncbi:MAG TPA: C45 family peptidase [Vicinamibacteria bacterium]|nr:C45 family peptidase [Vicinamibacteria bacterium]